jgi:crotonobetainyl-CoA:carnitine CoA-transferase CaiB-like acyl-CoA transferase
VFEAAAGVPCGKVLGLHEGLTSERTTRAGLVTTQPHPDTHTGAVPVLSPPYRSDGVRTPAHSAPPQLGEDTGEVLRDLLDQGAEVRPNDPVARARKGVWF